MPGPRPLDQRFWEKVTPEPNTGCWLWSGSAIQGGYGAIKVGTANKSAHRVAWFLTHGVWPPDELEVCHRCDNPPCVNPAHLFLATHKGNMDDRDAKGRNHVGAGDRHWQRLYPERRMRGDRNGTHTHPERLTRGESHHFARFTADQVRAVRERSAAGETRAALAREFHVSEPSILAIVKRRTWRHVP